MGHGALITGEVRMAGSFTLSTTLPASAEVLYKAWLSTKEHTAFTGSPAKASSRAGGSFSAWEEYITGRNLELKPFKKIVQSWRSTDFADSDPDSTLTVVFEKAAKGTRLTIAHANLPKGQSAGCKQGWKDYYFKPMKTYFAAGKK
jgi:activator of HSP90 ATPase